ncbi:MAG: lamin tail domain-containing protein [Rubrivivax sp.]|jgi:predicted extracellular nuclease
MNRQPLWAALALSATTFAAQAQVQITEWMYSGNGPEFIEFTNMGSTAISLVGWSFDDDSRTAGVVNLSGLGTLGVGESLILTEASAADFRAAWGLASTVKVQGNNTTNLGRNDEINLFNASGSLVDRLTYGDQNFAGTIRTQTSSGSPVSLQALGATTVGAGWVLSSTSDAYGSYLSAQGDVGNPGSFIFAPVPEASTWALMAAGLGMVGAALRRRQA